MSQVLGPCLLVLDTFKVILYWGEGIVCHYIVI